MEWPISTHCRGRIFLSIFVTMACALTFEVHAQSHPVSPLKIAQLAPIPAGAAASQTSQTLTFSVYPSAYTPLYGVVVINFTTCKEISSGTFAITAAPKYGVAVAGTTTALDTTPPCAGNTYTYATMNYTWKSTDPAAISDTFLATYTAPGHNIIFTFDINLIHLQIDLISPPVNDQYPITVMPSMPVVRAQAKVLHVSPDPTATTVFKWTATIGVHDGKNINHDYNTYLQQSLTTTGSAPYSLTTVPSTTLVGGKLALKVTATVNGVTLTGSTTTGPTIVGTNPQRSAIQSLIAATVPTLSLDGLRSADVIDVNERMTCQESQQRQFNAAANGGIGPVYFAPDNGIGIAQLTDPTYFFDPNFLFNWKSNTQRGLSLYSSKIPAAQGYPSLLKSTPSYKIAIDQVNAYRTSHGLSPIASPPAPPFTQTGVIGSTPTNQLLEDSTRYYNGYGKMRLYGHSLHEFKPDLNYLKSVPNAQLAGLATDPKVWTRVPGTVLARGSDGDPNYVTNVTAQPPQCGN